MKKLDLAPCHLFSRRDSFYALDLEANTVLQLDAPAYEAVALRLANTPWPAITDRLSETYSPAVVQTVLRELQWLESQGLLRSPIQTYDDDENEAYIQQLVRMTTNKIELYLAEACNLRCRYCYVGANHALNNGLMPSEIARQAIDLVFRRAGKAKQVGITFFGGEPLLNKPVLREAIDYSQRMGAERGVKVTYSMTTNATLLDDEVIDLIKRYNFGLMISLDGPKEVQDHMRPFVDGSGSFDQAKHNIQRLMRRRRNLTVRCTLSKECLDRPAIVDFLEAFGFSRIAMSRCSGKSTGQGPYDIGPAEVATLKAQDAFFIQRLFEQLERGEPIRFNPWAAAIQGIHHKEERRMRCGVGRGCTTVGIDGNLYPCHRYVGMKAFVLGHVSTGIDREKYAAYLRGYFETKRACEDCWAVNICGGYCPWYVSAEDGTFSPPQRWWCDEVRDWYEQGVWLYDTLRSRYPDFFCELVGDAGKGEPVLR